MKIFKIISFILLIHLTPLWYWFDPNLNGFNLLKGWPEALSIFIIFIAVLILAGYSNGKRFILSKEFFKSVFIDYHIWGAVQQSILFLLFALLLKVFPQDSIFPIIIASGLFGVLHFPNYVLMFSTCSLGFLFTLHFSDFGNILIPFLFHGLMASFLQYTIPDPISTNWNIWVNYTKHQKSLLDKLQKN